MRRQFFAAGLSVCLAVLTLFSFAGCGKREYELLEKNECHRVVLESSEDYQENHAKSLIEYEKEMLRFKTSDGGYADNFGGSFVDSNGIYTICIVGSQTLSESEYVNYKKVAVSFNSLNDIYGALIQLIGEYTIWDMHICEICNKVQVCVEDEKQIDLIIQRLKTDRLFKRNSLLFYVGRKEIDKLD